MAAAWRAGCRCVWSAPLRPQSTRAAHAAHLTITNHIATRSAATPLHLPLHFAAGRARVARRSQRGQSRTEGASPGVSDRPAASKQEERDRSLVVQRPPGLAPEQVLVQRSVRQARQQPPPAQEQAHVRAGPAEVTPRAQIPQRTHAHLPRPRARLASQRSQSLPRGCGSGPLGGART